MEGPSIQAAATGIQATAFAQPKARSFDAVESHFLRRGKGAEFDMEVAWVRRHLPSCPGPILDVGCGIGALFPAIGEHRVIGVDLQRDGLLSTRRLHPNARLSCAPAEHLPFRDRAFRTITAQHVIEHLHEPGVALAEWLRLLRPGGTLLILTPNSAYCDPSAFYDPTHVHLFEAADMARLLRVGGFELLDLRTLGLPWFRRHGRVPGLWRLRRGVTRGARQISCVPTLRWRGQTLCCAARRPS